MIKNLINIFLMIGTLISLFFKIVEISTGLVFPLLFAIQASVQQDSDG